MTTKLPYFFYKPDNVRQGALYMCNMATQAAQLEDTSLKTLLLQKSDI